MLSRIFFAGTLLGLLASAACGGKTTGSVNPPDPLAMTPDAALPPSPEPTPTPTPEPSPDDAGACVQIDVTPADLACSVDGDCSYGETGLICESSCDCPNAAVNNAAAAKFSAEIPPSTVDCGCGIGGSPRCIRGSCTLCGFGSSGDCGDGGVTPPIVVDAGPILADAAGPKCVDVDLTGYDVSCATAGDCMNILSGTVCDGACECRGANIVGVSMTNQSQYAATLSGISLSQCHCLGPSPAQCIAGQCVNCDTPNALCGDGDAGHSKTPDAGP